METDLRYKMKLGTRAFPFALPGVDGRDHALADFKRPFLAVVFTCNHCPYAQAYEGRLIALAGVNKDTDVVAVNSNDDDGYPEDSFANMVRRAQDRGFPFPYLHDGSQDVAHAYGAECTPHVFLFDRERRLCYQGAIDDNWREPEKVRKRYLQEALDALRAGKGVAVPLTNAHGCSIKWKAE